MNIFNKYRRKARIAYDILDYNFLVNPEEAQLRRLRGDDGLPIHYIVKVQVKVAFFWVTVWSESTDYSDGDSREVINKRAQTLCEALQN